MRKLYIFAALMTALTILFPLLMPPAAALDVPDVPAEAGLLIEAGTGLILYEKDMNKKVAPGGIVKVMTLLIAIRAVENETADLEDSVTATASALNTTGSEGGVLNIGEGETMSLKDLMHFAYIASDANACNIIAEHIAGSPGAFAMMMNDEARRLGCSDTRFTNADGAPDSEQYTTAWDQCLIMREAVQHILFTQIAGTLTYRAPARVVENSNLMLYGSGSFFNKYCVAGKTDDMAAPGDKSSFIACAKNGSMTLICVVFGTDETSSGGETAAERSYLETKQLFDWGFSSFAWYTVLDQADIVAQDSVELARETDTVELRPQETITVLARADVTAEDIRREIVLFGQAEGKTLTAPVAEGTILGEIRIYIDGHFRGQSKLVAAYDIGLDRAAFLKTRVSETLDNFWVQAGAAFLVLLLAGYIVLIIRDIKKRRNKKRKLEETKKKLIEERHKIYK